MYLRATNNGKDQLVNWGLIYATFSPNGNFIASSIYPIQILNILNNRKATLFTPEQTRFSFPDDYNALGASMFWLPDSSGILINVYAQSGEKEINKIWKADITGEASIVSDGIKILGSSSNGKQWLILVNKKYYLISVQ